MKRILVLSAMLAFMASCQTSLDDRDPVATDQWRTSFVRQLQNADNDSIRISLMNENGIRLTKQLVEFLRSHNFNCKIDTIIYRYGSGTAKGVASGDGKTYDGSFKPQPYAVVKGGPCFQDSMYVFILCFNGTFELYSKNQRDIGSITSFTIEAGNGINWYLPNYNASIDLAEKFDIPVYRGKTQSENHRISYDEARALKDEIDRVQVTVRVFTGDVFDLNNMTYNGRKAKR